MKKKLSVSKHILVPPHTKLNESEKKALLEKYKISLSELPRISIKDPAIESLKVKPGDVIKIIRKSPTAGTTVFYRSVINE
jgi:DNA-directed RNA polymerase subunit H